MQVGLSGPFESLDAARCAGGGQRHRCGICKEEAGLGGARVSPPHIWGPSHQGLLGQLADLWRWWVGGGMWKWLRVRVLPNLSRFLGHLAGQ